MSILPQLTYFAEKVAPPPGIITTAPADDPTLKNIVNVVLALGAAIAVAYIVFGGLKYTLSRGEPNETKQARDTILYAVVGLIIVVVSFMLVNYVIGQF